MPVGMKYGNSRMKFLRRTVDRVEAELAGGLVDHLLEHPVVHLGAEAPVGALLVLVGQHRLHPVPHAGDRVRAGDLGEGVAVVAHAELDVGAVVVDARRS